jgi:hypothetical protein
MRLSKNSSPSAAESAAAANSMAANNLMRVALL